MSSIFNLLDGLTESNKDTIKPVARPKTPHEMKSNPVKAMGGVKPKGLSMRSISDMNVARSLHPVNIKKSTFANKEQEFQKLKVTQTDSSGRPISPGKEIPIKKQIQMIKFKQAALKEETKFNKNIKSPKILNDDIFKKPLPPKRFVKRFPDQEKLAYYYEENDIDHIELMEKVMEKDFKDLFLKGKENMSYKDQEFLSDSEILITPEMPKFIFPTTFNREYIELSSPELPEISDDDDF